LKDRIAVKERNLLGAAVVYPPSYGRLLLTPNWVALGDMNGDGKLDLLVANVCASSSSCDNGSVSVVLGKGDGTFHSLVFYGSGGQQRGASSVAVGDLNGDGKPDLVVANYCASSSSCANGTVGVLLARTTTIVTLASSLNPSYLNQSVTFTATVTSPYSGAPTGSVTFKEGSTTLASAPVTSGQVAYTTTYTTAGTHQITAIYSGDNNNLGSTSPILKQVVNKVLTTTTLTSSQNPSTFSQMVTFAATVSSSQGTPPDGETVTFKQGATVLGTGALSGGMASFSTSSLNAGTLTITAGYSGDATLATSSGTVKQTVKKATTGTTLTSSPNPSSAGQTVTFTSVVSSSAGTPGGTVTFKQGTTTLGTGTLDATGMATYSISSLAVGSDKIVATYGGSTNYATSKSPAVSYTHLTLPTICSV